ncbi:uncharacterized protein LOC9663288 [Selaginella moellendorffii]|nr:uncharacterized protein LOC9663288 [Selaginella moellendorffii]|eukprot:XP_002987902.2 uncharacterized protein LOC9663288 [Selaginella moellendorffii]
MALSPGACGYQVSSRAFHCEPRNRRLLSGCSIPRQRRWQCSSLGIENPVLSEEKKQRTLTHSPILEWNDALSCCEPHGQHRLRVAVLVSGGVDSSVALRLLCGAGHSCTAFYIKIWFQEDFQNFWSSCPWEEDLKYAQDVCDEVGVKLEIVHLTDVYWNKVVSKCITEVRAGRTPNPDIMCNTVVKFGAFLDHIDRTKFDRVASGHYARVERYVDEQGTIRARLMLSKDEVKDQTYFLSQLSQEQLGFLMFPLGSLAKPEVRQLAHSLNLPNKDRKDSQGICFLGKVKFSDFISRHLGEKEGLLIEAETGKTMGKHKGFWFYTIGQRRGISLSHGPWYVVAKDSEKNLVYISRHYFSGDKKRRNFYVDNLSWFSTIPDPSCPIKCKVRHGPSFHDCELEFEREKQGARVKLLHSDQALAAGQYAAFYAGETCLGSGMITESMDDLESCTVSARALEDGRTTLGVVKQDEHTKSLPLGTTVARLIVDKLLVPSVRKLEQILAKILTHHHSDP